MVNKINVKEIKIKKEINLIMILKSVLDYKK